MDDLATIDKSRFPMKEQEKRESQTTRIEGVLITLKHPYFEEPVVDYSIDSPDVFHALFI